MMIWKFSFKITEPNGFGDFFNILDTIGKNNLDYLIEEGK